MRVLFLSNESDVSRSASAYTHRLERLRCALEQYGVQTGFLSLRDQPFGRPLLAQPLNLPFVRRQIADYDFIHAGGDAAYTAAVLKPYTRAQVIRDVHGDTFSEAQLKWTSRRHPHTAHMLAQSWITNAVAYRQSDYFLVVCKPLGQRLAEEKRIPPERIVLIRNGVDLTVFTGQPARLPEPFTIAYAGGFQTWQGIENLVGAVEQLPADRVRLTIIGFTEQYASLRASISQRLGPRAHLVDRVGRAELAGHLAASHALVIPRSPHRAVAVALPTKFAEYLALGKPVIVCDVDETAALVRAHRCGLVSASQPADLANTIQQMADLPLSELDAMGQRGRRLAEQEFSWEVIGRQYFDALMAWSAA